MHQTCVAAHQLLPHRRMALLDQNRRAMQFASVPVRLGCPPKSKGPRSIPQDGSKLVATHGTVAVILLTRDGSVLQTLRGHTVGVIVVSHTVAGCTPRTRRAPRTAHTGRLMASASPRAAQIALLSYGAPHRRPPNNASAMTPLCKPSPGTPSPINSQSLLAPPSLYLPGNCTAGALVPTPMYVLQHSTSLIPVFFGKRCCCVAKKNNTDTLHF